MERFRRRRKKLLSIDPRIGGLTRLERRGYPNDKTILPTEEPCSTAAKAEAASASGKVFCTCVFTWPDATSPTI
jgi:hypothetical protein